MSPATGSRLVIDFPIPVLVLSFALPVSDPFLFLEPRFGDRLEAERFFGLLPERVFFGLLLLNGFSSPTNSIFLPSSFSIPNSSLFSSWLTREMAAAFASPACPSDAGHSLRGHWATRS